MANPNSTAARKRTQKNQRRERMSFSEVLSLANRRAHDHANRRSGRRQLMSVQAAIAATDIDDELETPAWGKRLFRWLLALILLPPAGVTSWTLLTRFSHATLSQGFWQSAEFWYFTIGGLLMIGWFWSGLLHSFFLYLYVLGHELTHVVFVWLCRGKVSSIHVSTRGGYITTNKTNLLIALSPYFVPFWSVIAAIIYSALHYSIKIAPHWDLAFYGIIGVTWTFHMIWTLWMIPRDQPDLKENGTLLSLVIIYFANLLVLITLLCVAEDAPLRHAKEFARDWLKYAIIFGDSVFDIANRSIQSLSNHLMF